MFQSLFVRQAHFREYNLRFTRLNILKLLCLMIWTSLERTEESVVIKHLLDKFVELHILYIFAPTNWTSPVFFLPIIDALTTKSSVAIWALERVGDDLEAECACKMAIILMLNFIFRLNLLLVHRYGPCKCWNRCLHVNIIFFVLGLELFYEFSWFDHCSWGKLLKLFIINDSWNGRVFSIES